MADDYETPDNETTGKRKKGMSEGAKSFLKAWILVIVIVALIVGGISISRSRNSSTKTTKETTEDKTTAAPKDIPIYEGAVATSHRVTGKVEFYEYELPQGSVSTVNDFYTAKMSENKWRRLPGSNDYEAKYSQDDGREATILLSYEAGKVHLKITVRAP